MKNGATVYQYILTYQGEYSYTNIFGLPTIGVCHGDDLIYIFNQLWLNDEDAFVRHLMTTAWTNFAKYGDPTPPDSGYEWVPRVGNIHNYFDISGPDSAMTISEEIEERTAIWDQVFEKTK